MDPLLPINPAARNEDGAISTPSASNKRHKGGAPNRQSYSHFTKVSLVKRFLATKQTSYARYLQRLTPQELQGTGIQDPAHIPPSKTFRKWLVDEEILQAVESNLVLQPNRKRQRKCEFPQVESVLRKVSRNMMRIGNALGMNAVLTVMVQTAHGRDRGTVNFSIASQSNGNCGTNLAAGPLVYCQQWMDAKSIRERTKLQLDNGIAGNGNR
jgi:hypothetical protein